MDFDQTHTSLFLRASCFAEFLKYFQRSVRQEFLPSAPIATGWSQKSSMLLDCTSALDQTLGQCQPHFIAANEPSLKLIANSVRMAAEILEQAKHKNDRREVTDQLFGALPSLDGSLNDLKIWSQHTQKTIDPERLKSERVSPMPLKLKFPDLNPAKRQSDAVYYLEKESAGSDIVKICNASRWAYLSTYHLGVAMPEAWSTVLHDNVISRHQEALRQAEEIVSQNSFGDVFAEFDVSDPRQAEFLAARCVESVNWRLQQLHQFPKWQFEQSALKALGLAA